MRPDIHSLPRSRGEAKAAGSKWYFTGKPCVRGHLAPRFTSIGKCMDCACLDSAKQNPPSTDRTRAYTNLETFVAAATEKHGGVYDYSRAKYVSAHTPLEVLCPHHGSFMISPTNHIQGKGCRKCGVARTRALQVKTKEVFIQQSIELWGEGVFDYSRVVYSQARQPVDLRCIKHDKWFSQLPYNHLSGQMACTKCNHKRSRPQEALADFVRELGFTIEENVTRLGVLDQYEADIWVPSLGVAIEHHGLHYHSTKRASDRKVHRAKWEVAQKNGIRLVQVFEDEWNNKRGVVESRIKSILGVSPRTFARKLSVRSVFPVDVKEFLAAHHLQGAGSAQAAYALYDNEEIVAVATFCKARKGSMTHDASPDWEVLRYASIGTVVGGFSRLFKAFLRDYKPHRVVSYCDLRYGVGNVYKAAGFDLDSITQPDYWWVSPKDMKRIPRYQTQKHKLATHPLFGVFFTPDRTESEVCEAAGFRKLYGVGNQKWIWHAPCAIRNSSPGQPD